MGGHEYRGFVFILVRQDGVAFLHVHSPLPFLIGLDDMMAYAD